MHKDPSPMKMISIAAERKRLRSYTLGAGVRTRSKYPHNRFRQIIGYPSAAKKILSGASPILKAEVEKKVHAL